MVRRRHLDSDALYDEAGIYSFGRRGYNWRALVAIVVGILPNIPGFVAQASGGTVHVAPAFDFLYTYAWFVSLSLAGITHYALSAAFPLSATEAPEPDQSTRN